LVLAEQVDIKVLVSGPTVRMVKLRQSQLLQIHTMQLVVAVVVVMYDEQVPVVVPAVVVH
jgi:hypothetical protein